MKNVIEVKHSLLKNLVNSIRDVDIQSNLFRKYIGAITKILMFEAFKNEKMVSKRIKTWQGENEFEFLLEEDYVFIPILRAALPMLDGIIEILPNAKAGFLALKRDEKTFESKLYYDRVPDISGKTAVILDPMVATGGTLEYAIDVVKKKGPDRVISFNIVGVKEGLSRVVSAHPDVEIYIAQIDERLNDKKYIIPGIGDAGDRAYNTL
ncbi:uracil phosphoribosyltransferase [Nitrosophilus alvini]|uniref:uracil phosphoribosyltransferase n=1 Tax=Nitrosophilus alvini TaxID=2714855 RepID=UPI00190A6F46|nr:uracil phosphoribosyltransferase [Nitrosophilus alvini]